MIVEKFCLQPQPFEGMCCANLRNVIWKLFEDPNSSKAAKVRNRKENRFCTFRIKKIKSHRQKVWGSKVISPFECLIGLIDTILTTMANVGADFANLETLVALNIIQKTGFGRSFKLT